ncbi:MAG: hypothetical protein WCC22_07510 [Terriglobales bacterium]
MNDFQCFASTGVKSPVNAMPEHRDCLDLAYIAGPRAGDLGDLLADIYTVCLWQICRTLVLAPGANVVERLLLEAGLQFQRQANADKRIPSALGLMVTDDELQGFVFSERILDAVDFVSMLEQCQSPAPKASENRAIRRDQNRVAEGRVRHPDGLVELAHHTDPVEFIHRSMQPQLFWGTNNRTPLQPTRRGRIERLRRDCGDELYGA